TAGGTWSAPQLPYSDWPSAPHDDVLQIRVDLDAGFATGPVEHGIHVARLLGPPQKGRAGSRSREFPEHGGEEAPAEWRGAGQGFGGRLGSPGAGHAPAPRVEFASTHRWPLQWPTNKLTGPARPGR